MPFLEGPTSKKEGAGSETVEDVRRAEAGVNQVKPTFYRSMIVQSNEKHEIPNEAACTTHLRLLAAFVNLREGVEAWGKSCSIDLEIAWQTFVKLAAVRFTHWFRSEQLSEITSSLPPLDILMVWHSFMLNPSHYLQFSKVARQDRGGQSGFSWTSIQNAINLETETFMLSQTAIKNIESLRLHQDLLEVLQEHCGTLSRLEELMSFGLKLHRNDDKLQTLLQGFDCLSAANFTYAELGMDFDPAAAVHRQARFADKISQFNWLHSPDLYSLLQHANTRYRNFFSLIAEGVSPITPALDIDLVWHTHQLTPDRYGSFSRAVTHGRFVNHNDMADVKSLHTGAQASSCAYRAKFGAEYFLCHSWYCTSARFSNDGSLANRNIARIRQLIEKEKQRLTLLGRSRIVEKMECRCYLSYRGSFGGLEHDDALDCSTTSQCGAACSACSANECGAQCDGGGSPTCSDE